MHLYRWRAYAGILLLGMIDPALPAVAAETQATPGGPSSAADDSQLQTIVVTGLRESLGKSLQLKQSSDIVLDSINALELGRFPDDDVADSLRHITGVSIL